MEFVVGENMHVYRVFLLTRIDDTSRSMESFGSPLVAVSCDLVYVLQLSAARLDERGSAHHHRNYYNFRCC